MYWFRRPPLLRPVGAALILLAALVAEFGGAAPVAYPFASTDLNPGDPITDVEWREAPAGLLTIPDLEGAYAVHRLAAGEPLVASSLTYGRPVPEGWWALSVEMPTVTAPGTRVRLVTSDPPDVVPGIVVQQGAADSFGLGGPSALVAVPEDSAARVAAAVDGGRVVALIQPG